MDTNKRFASTPCQPIKSLAVATLFVAGAFLGSAFLQLAVDSGAVATDAIGHGLSPLADRLTEEILTLYPAVH